MDTDEKPYDAGNPEDVKAARKGERRSQLLRKDMVAAIMSLPQGREWIWDILVFSGVNGEPLSTTPEYTAFNIGKGTVGRYILADITSITPDLYIQMLKEKQDVQHRHNDSRINGNEAGGDNRDKAGGDRSQSGNYVNDN